MHPPAAARFLPEAFLTRILQLSAEGGTGGHQVRMDRQRGDKL
jgi:hypothetical protein